MGHLMKSVMLWDPTQLTHSLPCVFARGQVAAQTLVVGGRLCYLLASTWEFDLARDLPRHPCLELSHHSVQGLTQLLCRRLITMTKVKEMYYCCTIFIISSLFVFLAFF